VFSTASDNQPAVDIHVLQGERPIAADNRTLGKFQLTNIPPAQRGVPKIEVTFDIDANGIINVSAKDQGTGKEQKIKIESGSKLSQDEIEKMRNDAKENEKSDQERLKKTKILNDSDSMLFQAEKMAKDLEEKLTEEEKTKMKELIDGLRKTRESEDVDAIESQMNEVAESLSEISARVYSESQKDQESTNPETKENVEDVVVEEVK
jgi:molecular chaperone DnaK